jgi:hypothetical protein
MKSAFARSENSDDESFLTPHVRIHVVMTQLSVSINTVTGKEDNPPHLSPFGLFACFYSVHFFQSKPSFFSFFYHAARRVHST